MERKASKRARFALGVLFSVAGLFLALRGVDWATLGATLRQVHLGWLLAAVVVEMLSLWINAVRWRWLFWPHYQPRGGRLYAILCVAQLANTVLPGRLGLPLRVLLVGDGGQVSRATAATTLAVEKALEGVTLFPLGIFLFLAVDLPAWLRLSAALFGFLLLGLLLLIWAGLRWRDTILKRMSSRAPEWLLSVSRALLDGLDALRSVQVGWRLWGLSCVYWAMLAVVNGMVMQAVGLEVPPVALLALLFVLQIGLRLPSSPGSIGVFDFLGIVSLSIFGVDKTSALGAMLVLHMILYLPPSVVGVGYLLWTSTGLGQLRQAALRLQEH